MFNCYVHHWSSHQSMCPACQIITTSTTTDAEINLAFENVSLEDRYKSALKMLEEMAGALELYAITNDTFPEYGAVAREMLEKYRQFKKGCQ